MIAPALKRYVAGKAAASRNRTPFLALAIAALIVLALARPGGHAGDEVDLTGIAGRVIVMDATRTSRVRRFSSESLKRLTHPCPLRSSPLALTPI